MGAKHTPGPWRIDSKDDSHVVAGHGPATMSVAVASFSGVSPDDEDKANARLIAAAPDLLEALEELENVLHHAGPCQCCTGNSESRSQLRGRNEDGHEAGCCVLRARAAIARAERGTR